MCFNLCDETARHNKISLKTKAIHNPAPEMSWRLKKKDYEIFQDVHSFFFFIMKGSHFLLLKENIDKRKGRGRSN